MAKKWGSVTATERASIRKRNQSEGQPTAAEYTTLICGGNAYRIKDDMLEYAPVKTSGAIDEDEWSAVDLFCLDDETRERDQVIKAALKMVGAP